MARTPGRGSSRAAFLDALRGLATGIAETAGFTIASISVAFDDVMETLAVEGPEDVRRRLSRHHLPLETVEKEISNAEHWGDLRFVPHASVLASLDGLDVDADRDTPEDPELWHPLDLLFAPIHDQTGKLRGVVALDQPVNGRRPSAEGLAAVQHYIAMVRRTILYAIERVELDEQIHMWEAVRKVIREASSDVTIGGIIDYTQTALTTTYNASGLWIQTFDEDGDGLGAVYASSGADIHLKEHLREVARPAARLLWQQQTVAVIDESMPRTPAMTPEQEQQVFEFMRIIDVTSMLFVPLGAGKECLGNLVLTRVDGDTTWTDLEQKTALDIGHDLGRALINARSLERERRLVEELRELDSYKSRLITTLAHELKNPLSAILGHAEMLESTSPLTPAAQNSVSAVERGAARMQRLIEGLLALGQAGDPGAAFQPEPVDLRHMVDEVVDMLKVTVQRKSLQVSVSGPDHALALGDPGGLDQVLSNLISNATKYTPEGGRIDVRLSVAADVVTVAVRDTGLGISDADQQQLFQEFFRSTNPAAVAQPGTGLGLAITQRIIERHSGTVTCESVLGAGSTFTVTVPAA